MPPASMRPVSREGPTRGPSSGAGPGVTVPEAAVASGAWHKSQLLQRCEADSASSDCAVEMASEGSA